MVRQIWLLLPFILNAKEIMNFFFRQTKVIKEKWGQYFAIDHFCTPLCSKRNGNIVIKKFLEQKFAKSSVINLVPNAWFNDKNAIKKVRVELVFRYCLYYALWLWFWYIYKSMIFFVKLLIQTQTLTSYKKTFFNAPKLPSRHHQRECSAF